MPGAPARGRHRDRRSAQHTTYPIYMCLRKKMSHTFSPCIHPYIVQRAGTSDAVIGDVPNPSKQHAQNSNRTRYGTLHRDTIWPFALLMPVQYNTPNITYLRNYRRGQLPAITVWGDFRFLGQPTPPKRRWSGRRHRNLGLAPHQRRVRLRQPPEQDERFSDA